MGTGAPSGAMPNECDLFWGKSWNGNVVYISKTRAEDQDTLHFIVLLLIGVGADPVDQ